jgi:O-antigen/teichoic acid export membrane protein
MSANFSGERIRSGLIHFLLGKVVSSIAGFGAVILLVRHLSINEFAQYSVLFALVEYFTAISGFGLLHAATRYVPEMFAKGQYRSLQQFTKVVVGLRLLLLLLIAGIAFVYAPQLASMLQLEQALDAFRVFCMVAFIRAGGHFLSMILESTLHQGRVQLAYSIASIGRFMGMLWLVHIGKIDLIQVLYVEAATDLIAFIMMLAALFIRAQGNTPRDAADDGHWLRQNLAQVWRLAKTGYLQHLASLPFGSNTNRLLAGHLLGAFAVASFGYSQSLYEYFKRYLPAQLLVGMLRPIIIARFAQSGRFEDAADVSRGIFLINFVLLGGAFVAIGGAGTELLSFISAGKYGQDAAYILLALLGVLLLETNRLQLELLVQAVEGYELLIWSNLLLSVSAVLGYVGSHYLGAVAFPLANLAALLLSNRWVGAQLAKRGYRYAPDGLTVFKVSMAILVALGFCLAVNWKWPDQWLFAMLFSLILYSGFVHVIAFKQIAAFVRSLTSNKSVPTVRT